MTSLTETIGALIQPLVSADGLQLWDVEQAPGVLRILVDRPGGIDLDQLGHLAQNISEALDAHESLQPESRYQLEVSSPGVERTLRTPAHYQQFVGSLVSVKTTESIDGSRRFQGVLQAADEVGISLTDDDSTDTVRDFAYVQIQKAHTVLVWGPAPKPGTNRSRAGVSGASAGRVGAGQAAGRPKPSMKDIAP